MGLHGRWGLRAAANATTTANGSDANGDNATTGNANAGAGASASAASATATTAKANIEANIEANAATPSTATPSPPPQDPKLYDLIAPAAAATADTASPHSLSDLAWAFAAAGRPAPGLFAAVARSAAGRMSQRFGLGMLSDLLWWVSRHCPGGQQAGRASRLEGGVPPCSVPRGTAPLQRSPPASSNAPLPVQMHVPSLPLPVLRARPMKQCPISPPPRPEPHPPRACAAAGHRDDALLAAAAGQLPRHMARMRTDADAQAKVVWALATLGYRNEGLEEELRAAGLGEAAALLSGEGGGEGGGGEGGGGGAAGGGGGKESYGRRAVEPGMVVAT